MRKIATLKKPIDDIKRLMIYTDEFGTYLFGYKSLFDSGAEWDAWYETETLALSACEAIYKVNQNDWTEIPDPEPYCQHDFINSVRVKGRENGKPEFGKLEKLVNGKWIDFLPNE